MICSAPCRCLPIVLLLPAPRLYRSRWSSLRGEGQGRPGGPHVGAGAAIGNPIAGGQSPDIAGGTHPRRWRGHRWTGSAPVEQVGRRRSGRRRLGREPEVGENPPDDDGVLDGGHHTHAAATPSTRQHVHPERVLHQLRPRPLSRRRRRGLLHAHGGGWISTRRWHRRRWLAVASSDREVAFEVRSKLPPYSAAVATGSSA